MRAGLFSGLPDGKLPGAPTRQLRLVIAFRLLTIEAIEDIGRNRRLSLHGLLAVIDSLLWPARCCIWICEGDSRRDRCGATRDGRSIGTRNFGEQRWPTTADDSDQQPAQPHGSSVPPQRPRACAAQYAKRNAVFRLPPSARSHDPVGPCDQQRLERQPPPQRPRW